MITIAVVAGAVTRRTIRTVIELSGQVLFDLSELCSPGDGVIESDAVNIHDR